MSYARTRPTRFDGTASVLRLNNPNYKKPFRNRNAKLYLELKRRGKLKMVSKFPKFKLEPQTYREWSENRMIKILRRL